MTQEIIEMARDSGMELYGLGKDRARFVHHLEAFAKLVAEKALADHAMQEVQRLGQEIEQEPVACVEFMRQVLSVAIGGLYEHYKDDVLRVFTLDELQAVVDLSDPLRPQQVEDIYKRAWIMLAEQPAPVQPPEQEPVAYATKEDFHRELERRLKRIREEMKIKSVTMRCKDYDIALPIIDTDFGRVLVGQVSTPPQRTEQEPVAWMWRCNPYCDWPNWEVSLKRPADSGCYGDKRTEGYEDVPLYTSPPQRKPLTEEQRKDLINKVWNKWLSGEDDNHLFAWHFSFEVEAAHGIKENT